ncbi:unnamed protein product [Rotaria magnacalcarata]|nr:unnamed protein product [Rotaria magnacalcarata]
MALIDLLEMILIGVIKMIRYIYMRGLMNVKGIRLADCSSWDDNATYLMDYNELFVHNALQCPLFRKIYYMGIFIHCFLFKYLRILGGLSMNGKNATILSENFLFENIAFEKRL